MSPGTEQAANQLTGCERWGPFSGGFQSATRAARLYGASAAISEFRFGCSGELSRTRRSSFVGRKEIITIPRKGSVRLVQKVRGTMRAVREGTEPAENKTIVSPL